MIIKKYEKFLESIEDGYSDKFDSEFSESNEKIEKILDLSDEWVREELILMTNSELDSLLLSLRKTESSTIKNYTDKKQFSFDSIFGVTDEEILSYVSDIIDQFDYMEFSIVSDDVDKFSIELYSTDSSKILSSEFEWYKENVSENLKAQLLNSHGLNLFSEKFDDKRNRIIIDVKRS